MKAFEKRRQMAGQGGFTLIELLVVIAILGVLAGVVVFAVGGINDTSDVTACKIEARTVKTAVQAFRSQERKYPTSDTDVMQTGETFIPGLLEQTPTNVTITYGTATVKPTYAWAGNCLTVAGLPTAP